MEHRNKIADARRSAGFLRPSQMRSCRTFFHGKVLGDRLNLDTLGRRMPRATPKLFDLRNSANLKNDLNAEQKDVIVRGKQPSLRLMSRKSSTSLNDTIDRSSR